MLYRKLKRVWSHNTWRYIPNFRETFPELNKLTSDELEERWKKLDIDFYSENQTPVKPWIRFTLPFALLLMGLMFIGLPFVFMITGKWTYPLTEKNRILNWFRALRLL